MANVARLGLAYLAALTLVACEPSEAEVRCQQALEQRVQAESDLVVAELAFRLRATPRPSRSTPAFLRGVVDGADLQEVTARLEAAQQQFEAAKAAVDRFCSGR